MITIEYENLDMFNAAWRMALVDVVLGVQSGVSEGCRQGAIEALATRRWKDRTGRAAEMLRGYLDTRSDRGAEGWIELRVPYASFLADGTEPHEIWPKAAWGTPKSRLKPGQSIRGKGKNQEHVVGRGMFLRWKDASGDSVFARVVHHPGTSGDFFMDRGVATCEGTIFREVDRTCVNVQKRWLDG